MWGVQDKQPQDKNISGLASPNVCVVWGREQLLNAYSKVLAILQGMLQ